MTARLEKFPLVTSYRRSGQRASSAVARFLSEDSGSGFHRRPSGARFSLPRRRSQVVRQRSAKPPSPVRLRSAPLHRAFASGRLHGGPFFVAERTLSSRDASPRSTAQAMLHGFALPAVLLTTSARNLRRHSPAVHAGRWPPRLYPPSAGLFPVSRVLRGATSIDSASGCEQTAGGGVHRVGLEMLYRFST